jgi:hypothetical protein
MAVTQVTSAPDLGSYQTVAAALDLDNRPPAGLILHAASVTETGEVQIIDIYESREALEAFGSERLFPAAAAVGMSETLMASGPPTVYDAVDLTVPR